MNPPQIARANKLSFNFFMTIIISIFDSFAVGRAGVSKSTQTKKNLVLYVDDVVFVSFVLNGKR